MNRIKLVTVALLLCCSAHGQSNLNAITTACPFLLMTPNTQSTSMGNIGVVASPTYYESGLSYNPALLSRNEKVIGAKISYGSLLREFVPDFRLSDIGFYYSLNKSIALGYFYNSASYGKQIIANSAGLAVDIKPLEYSTGLRVAKSFSQKFSAGFGFKYISSDFTRGKNLIDYPEWKARAFAADMGVDYRDELKLNNGDVFRYDWGTSVINIGNKMTYSGTNHANFLPISLQTGILCSYMKELGTDVKYSFDVAYQVQKLLVPTPQIYYDTISQNGNTGIAVYKTPDVSVARGMLESFYDAPGGMQEELREIVHQFGIENRISVKNFLLGARFGFLKEHEQKGGREQTVFGFGGGYKFLFLDIGCLYAKNRKQYYDITTSSPLDYSVSLRIKYNL